MTDTARRSEGPGPAVLDTLLFAPFDASVLPVRAGAGTGGINLLQTDTAFIRIRTAGAGRDVVLLSDGPSSVEHYGPLLDLLAPTWRVHIMEIPGFGFSWATSADALTFEGTVRAVRQALEALLTEPAVLGGLCVQAHVALAVAAQVPELCRGLLLAQATGWEQTRRWTAQTVDPGGTLSEPWRGQARWRRTRERAAIDGWYRLAAAPGYDVSTWQATARTVFRRGATNSLATLLQTWYTAPDLLTAVDVPSALLWGGADATHVQSGSDPWELAAVLRDPARLLAAENGHFLDLERPDLIAEALRRIAEQV